MRSRSDRRTRDNGESDDLSVRSRSDRRTRGSGESDDLSVRSRSDRRARDTVDAMPPMNESAEHFFIGDKDDGSQRSRSAGLPSCAGP